MATHRRRMSCIVVFAAAFGLATPVLADAEDWDWNYNIFYGRRSAREADWTPYRSYAEVGLEASWGKSDQPLLFATDVYVSRSHEREHGFRIESATRDLSLGFRRFWTFKKRFHPNVGAGLTYLQASIETQNKRRTLYERDSTYGLWIGAGLSYRLGAQINLGLAARLEALGDVKLLGESRDGTSTHLGVILGWGSKPKEK